ncbi:MAG: efflux RND transporter permease subunit, partial [Verrucomicrobiales bacterium]|nr:efflux RND transporter permease subunit [Verrucomicrobiales bacterium]
MLNALIRFSLQHRPLVLGAALLAVVFGWQALRSLPVEVLPDLTKPTVTILTEASGLAPEEVETLVTQPIEAAVQGVSGLDRLRSSSDVGLSLVFAEFGWGTDIYRARQMVQERLNPVLNTLPPQAQAGLTPVASLMGEILLVGIYDREGKIAPMDLRTLADWTVTRRLQSLPGVAEVLAIGGGIKQVQVRPDPWRLAAHGVTLEELQAALRRAAGNATSGYLQAGPREIVVRNVAMTTDLSELANTVIKLTDHRPVLVRDVAEVKLGVQPMRGDASVNGRTGVILSIDKAPGADTLKLTADIQAALDELRSALPEGVEMKILFRQGDFIEHAVGNLQEAIRDGAVMVALILFLFLLNLRTTLITLAAIPLSFAVTVLVFKAFDISVNSMTLGGLAVAIGMVVDDAIVDVENVYRRLRENRARLHPEPVLDVVARASAEVRGSIFFATLLVILVFLPLLSLQGLAGRLFPPIAIATITSMAASFVVSLTVIPVLCSLLLNPKSKKGHHAEHDGWAVRTLKRFASATSLRLARSQPMLVLGLSGMALVASLLLYPGMGKEFLPAFNEGSATISLASLPGTSLAQSNDIGEAGVRLLQTVPDVKSVGRRAGRAERDDHVMPVSVNEFDVEFNDDARPLDVVFAEIREKFQSLPGTFINIGQPIGHRLSHMLSAVPAKIAVKIFGTDLEVLREKAEQVKALGQSIPGLTDINVEAQVEIPQVRIEVSRERALAYGVQPGAINEQVSALVGGTDLTQLREGQRTVNLILRLDESWRDTPDKLGDLLLETSGGQRVPLRLLADVRTTGGPNVIHRENSQRRIVISANSSQRDLQSLVQQWETLVREQVQLPEGFFLRFEGEFQAREEAARRIMIYFGLVLLLIAMLLHAHFGSFRLVLMVLLNLPLALIGGLALTWWMIDNISVATLIGFIAVGGVAARNGIMMISHY